jgi:hypothetical protein
MVDTLALTVPPDDGPPSAAAEGGIPPSCAGIGVMDKWFRTAFQRRDIVGEATYLLLRRPDLV